MNYKEFLENNDRMFMKYFELLNNSDLTLGRLK